MTNVDVDLYVSYRFDETRYIYIFEIRSCLRKIYNSIYNFYNFNFIIL